ncbi:PucR family transcriptional regulator, partial [Streptomyces sp. NPDC059466]
LRVAAPVLLPGLGAAPHWQVVVARVEWDGGEMDGGPVAQSLLEEMLVDPLTTGPEHADRIAVAPTAGAAIARGPRAGGATLGPPGRRGRR